ncbi:hypothetical protein F4820DRAFT_425546 [Hypoxylon rubiginosum]|uniref:Uncharacterized protein n=1 Tax=Hypoxylon rubiginosum TaxID=110542 RepID=A0ACB9YWU5_9PEZI|nr:hypothetical protein F4820DRAFT_425546 [Hypoxylon rubiginosum]
MLASISGVAVSTIACSLTGQFTCFYDKLRNLQRQLVWCGLPQQLNKAVSLRLAPVYHLFGQFNCLVRLFHWIQTSSSFFRHVWQMV